MRKIEEEDFCISEGQIVKYLREILEENVIINESKRYGLVPYVNVKTEGLKGCLRLSLISDGVLYAEVLDEMNNSLQSRFFNEFYYEEDSIEKYKKQLNLFSTYYIEVREYLDEFLRLQEDISQGFLNSDSFSVKAFFDNGAFNTFYSINVWITNPGEEYPEKVGITRTGNKVLFDTTIDPKVDILSINPPAVNDILRIYWDLLDKALVI